MAIGDDEIAKGEATLKNMDNGETVQVSLPDGLITALYEKKIDAAMQNLTDSMEQFDAIEK